MKKRRIHLIPLPAIGIAGLAIAACSTSGTIQKPNIILIMADDMGYSDIGCFGSEIQTPNLDGLARQGIMFTQFYNASRSCPTRASLLTGLYQHQAGIGDMVNDRGYPAYQGYLNTECVTLAEALKHNGYNTYMSGKWHVGGKEEVHPLKRGFDRYFGLIDGAGSYYKPIAYRPNMLPVRWMLDDQDFFPPDTGFYFTDAVGDYALSFLGEKNGSEAPFFLYMAFTAPHWPLHALPEDIKKYRGKYMDGWDHLREERYRKMIDLGIIDSSTLLSPRDKDSPDWTSLTKEEKNMWDLRMAVYAAMIDRLDQNIGKVISRLESMKELDNTLIIFLADNGACHERTRNQSNFLECKGEIGTPDSFDAYEIPWANASNTPFRMFKHWVHEGGISTPFIAWYPDLIEGGRIFSQPGHITDIMPTLLDVAGGTYPTEYNGNSIQAMEGISLLPAFTGKDMNREKPIFWEHEGNRAVRSDNWKLVSAYDYQERKFKNWELYDLKKDRSELNDLSGKYPEITSNMINQYNLWAERVGVISKEILDQ